MSSIQKLQCLLNDQYAQLIVLVFLLLNSFSIYGQAKEELVSFAVVGDVPYGDEELAQFPALVQSMEESATAFIIHVGDIKGGSAPCTDNMISSRISAINEIDKPVIYIPGDNDWTDCHRRRAGGYEPLERLEFLRKEAFPKIGLSMGNPPMNLESQATQANFSLYPEHQRWSSNDVMFLTLHVLGSANGLATFRGREEEDHLEAVNRIEASIEWLMDGFEVATDNEAKAVVVAIHGNPLSLSAKRESRYNPKPFAGIITTLIEQASLYDKPVLLIHGDTHDYKFDQPFSQNDETIDQLYRLEGIGSPSIGWVEVTIESDSGEAVVFSASPHFLSD